jgi:ubiquinone/menaquinone biosynthesis C-methylase UbiE
MDALSHDSLHWQAVDRDAGAASTYLDLVTRLLDTMKGRVTAKLDLREGASVLEVGCGNGREAERLARLVGPTGHVVATDLSAELIEEARSRTAPLGLPIQFETADAQRLGYPARTFDAARVERMLQHVADPCRAVRELIRVVKPGGCVCASEPDWGTLAISGGDTRVANALTRYKSEIRITHGDIGRRLPGLFIAAGCSELSVEPVSLGLRDLAQADAVLGLAECLRGVVAEGWVSQGDADRWWEAAEDRDGAGSFLAMMTGVIVAARVP